MNASTGKYMVIIGLGLVATGLLVWFFHDKLHWLGRLPGDIRVERENFRFYFPVTTMLIFSVLLTLIIKLVQKL